MTAHPARRAIAEVTIIVTGILLALGVDAGWGWYQDRQDERAYLQALDEELESSLEQLQVRESLLARTMQTHEHLGAQFGPTNRAPADSLLAWLAETARNIDLNPSRAVLDDLLSSGAAQLIRNDSIRLGIGEYQRLITEARRHSEEVALVWRDRIQPYLEGFVPRSERLRSGAFDADLVPFPPSPFPAQFDEVFQSAAFESMLVQRWWRLNRQANAAVQMREAMVDLRRLIQAELDG